MSENLKYFRDESFFCSAVCRFGSYSKCVVSEVILGCCPLNISFEESDLDESDD